jgi:hypothetical protein
MQEYVELIMDDEICVREAALTNIANMLDFADDSKLATSNNAHR